MEYRRWRRACPYLVREGEGAVNVQPVVPLQLQQRVSQQLLEEQREGERSGARTAAVVFWGGGSRRKELQMWDRGSRRVQSGRPCQH